MSTILGVPLTEGSPVEEKFQIWNLLMFVHDIRLQGAYPAKIPRDVLVVA